MDNKHCQMMVTPPSPVSPEIPMLDYSHHHVREQYRQPYPSNPPQSENPHCMTGPSRNVHGERNDELDAKLFEHALANMRQDYKTFTAEEAKFQRHDQVPSMTRQDAQKNSPSSAKNTARDRARTKSSRTGVRPPRASALCATHPVLYNKQPTKHKYTMLPTPPPEYDESKLAFHPEHQSTPTQASALPWRLYTDPNRQISGEPRFDDPKYRMLKMDLNYHQPKVLSPTFMIGLPCGSMIEAANCYPDSRPRDAPSA